ncbi:MAG: hypothetical protein EBX50_16895 [Chitinophagia bacterium]|nr:hypothetical protein [Chitinophagia bacterium]
MFHLHERIWAYEEISEYIDSLKTAQERRTYDQAMRLYEYGDKLLSDIMEQDVINSKEQAVFVKKAALNIGDTADTLTRSMAELNQNGFLQDFRKEELSIAIGEFFYGMDIFRDGMIGIVKKMNISTGELFPGSPTPADHWGPVRSSLANSWSGLTDKTGRRTLETAYNAITFMVVIADRLEKVHAIGSYLPKRGPIFTSESSARYF